MNVIINFITKNKEIFLLILLILSVLVLFKYKLKEGHTDNTISECEYDYTNEILEVMTRYLDINNKMWSKLIEINNYYQEFQDEMKIHGMTASHEKTCGDDEAVLPIDIAQKYMKESEEYLIGDGGAYELFVEHTKLFEELKIYKSSGDYKTEVIVNRTEYDPNQSVEINGNTYYERGAWKGLEGSVDDPVTFDSGQLIGDPADYGNNTNYIKTYVYQACSVGEYIVGEIWKHCADSICQQMTSACDSEINNLTNKWTFDKTKICRGAKHKCPGSTNAFMSYIGMPKPGISTTIYVDPTLAAPTKDCPKARTQDQLIDCYYGNKDKSVTGTGKNTNDNNSNKHYWKYMTYYNTILNDIPKVKARIENKKIEIKNAEEKHQEELQKELAKLAAPVTNNDLGKGPIDCSTYGTITKEATGQNNANTVVGPRLCEEVGCTFKKANPRGNKKFKIICQ
tara:strand:- start:642 stop:2003 length:1362 start_codon:yes stop_codon:yes gene_type:complete